MKLKEFIKIIEAIAPPEGAMAHDNIGLLVGPDHDEIKSVLVALDCTPVTAKEAVDTEVDLLLTHHPIFFNGIKRFLPDDPETAGAYILARSGIGHIAAHTNLDAARGGVNDALAEALSLSDAVPFAEGDMGRVCALERPMALRDFARMIEERLGASARVCGDAWRMIGRVALVSGAGGDFLSQAAETGADVFLTGECKHHQALYASAAGLCVIEAGHYETERVVLLPLIKRLQELAPGVQYNLTRREEPCLRRL